MGKIDFAFLEGWMRKKKSSIKFSTMFGKDNARWFKVRRLKIEDKVGLALCYYESNRSYDIKGWIYLDEVSDIFDDKKSFTIVSSSRTFILTPETPAELKLWLKGLIQLCPQSNIENIESKFNTFSCHHFSHVFQP
jgi:hypothetical protein